MAHDRNDPVFAGNFLHETEQINVLLVGKLQPRKSAVLRALEHSRCQTLESDSAETRESGGCRITLYVKVDEKFYQVNIIDTADFGEVTKKNVTHERDDKVLLDLVQLCVKSSVTTLNCICFISDTVQTHQHDIDEFRQWMEFIGTEFSENSIMILPHADHSSKHSAKEFDPDIAEHEKNQNVYNFCKLGVLYHEISDFDELETHADKNNMYSATMTINLEKMALLQQQLVKVFVLTIGKQKVIGKLNKILNAAELEAQRQRAEPASELQTAIQLGYVWLEKDHELTQEKSVSKPNQS
ncbi:unnamed protein product [Adineta steineri]|uniref:AIG1-like protein n=1 Tax=Adineta steineri TaxID=433720 RepID=A0A813WPT6_9BILA|nr:unnamed protein product [Adineta steineri]